MQESISGGKVCISFSTVDLQTTKAETPGDGVVADGGGIYASAGVPDLVILIANNITGDANYGNIVMKYPTEGTRKSVSSTSATIEFDFAGKPAGEYIVYAFGNTEGLWPMTYDPSDDSINLSGSDLTSLTTAAQVEALKFRAQLRNTVGWEDGEYASANPKYDDGPAVQNARLPVSAKTAIHVSAGGNGDAYLELLRCVAKVTAVIKNNTGEALSLYNYKHTVHGINPTSGYVIPHDADVTGSAGNLLSNPCLKYDSPDLAIPITIEGSQAYDWYVFPSDGPSYTICIQFTLNKGGVGEKTYTYNSLPVTNWRAEDITALGRNQHLTITTRISKGVTVSFNFEVNEWTPHTESVLFE